MQNPKLINALSKSELKQLLDEKVIQYNSTDFITTDPIQIPHRFSSKEDIEISAFLTATIAWGNRKSIITNANKMMALVDQSPFEFIMQHQESDLKKLTSFLRTNHNPSSDRECLLVCGRSPEYLLLICPDGLPSSNSKNHDSCSISSARILAAISYVIGSLP